MKGAASDLSSTWTVGDQLDKGGFGRVYELSGGSHAAVAKFVPKAPGADRELLFVDLEGARNVVPIIDSGEYQDSWVLVMPRADKSLRKHLQESGDVLGFEDTLAVLLDVATALVDLDGSVVHRDLKPENVLLLNGSWCLADFGISRYAEASTTPDTHKWALTPPYAAPERWRAERATSAADVYALGVMGVEMLKGHSRFLAPRWRTTATSISMPTPRRSTAYLLRWRPCWTSACSRRQPPAPRRRTFWRAWPGSRRLHRVADSLPCRPPTRTMSVVGSTLTAMPQ